MIALILKKIFKILRIALIGIFSILFLLLVLFYLPPVQRWLKQELLEYVRTEMGITLEMEKLAITFPLNLSIRNVTAYTPSDTLLVAEDITVDVGLSQLLLGRLRADQIHFGGVNLDTDGLIEGIHLKGTVHTLSLQAKRWDMKRRYLLVNNALIDKANLHILLADTTQKKDTASGPPVLHKIQLIRGKIQKANLTLQMPLDSMSLFTNIQQLDVSDVMADLDHQKYRVGTAQLSTVRTSIALTNKEPQTDSTRIELRDGNLQLKRAVVAMESSEYSLSSVELQSGMISYDAIPGKPEKGFDPSHIQIRNIQLSADSLQMAGNEYSAVVRNLSMRERCGFVLDQLTSHIRVDSEKQILASLKAVTPHSSLSFNGRIASTLLDSVPQGNIAAQFLCQLGKPDLMMLAGSLPASFHQAYPNRSLLIEGTLNGNETQVNLQRMNAILPGAFSLQAGGNYAIKAESMRALLELKGENLNFLTALSGSRPDSTLIIPGIYLKSEITGKGTRYSTNTLLRESKGTVSLAASYDTGSESFSGKIDIDSLQVVHFLPQDTITGLKALVNLKGKGTDFYSTRTWMDATLRIENINLYSYHLQGISMDASLRNREAKATLSCNDSLLLVMNGDATLRMDKNLPTGEASLNVWYANLRRLGLVTNDMREPFSLSLDAKAGKEETVLDVQTGDLEFSLEGKHHFNKIIDETVAFAKLFDAQLKERKPNQQELRKVLPVARLNFSAGQNNLPNHILQETAGISFKDASIVMDASPEGGLRGIGHLYGIHTSAVDIDTVAFVARQDTNDMKFFTTIINGPYNEFYTFTAHLNTVIRNDNGDLIVKMIDRNGDVGADIGVRGTIKEDGFEFTLFPEEPVVAFHRMKLNTDNHLKLRDDGRLEANLLMHEPQSGMGIEVTSNDTTTAKQDFRVNLQKIDVGDVIRSFPFLPDIDGLFSGNFHIMERQKLYFTVKSELKEGKYNGMLLGDLGLNAGYTPDSLANQHLIGAQLTRNGEKVVSVGGAYQAERSELVRSTLVMHAFPLELVDGFIPDQMVRMKGKAEGRIQASGKIERLKIDGFMKLDSASAEVPMANTTLYFRDKQITVEDNLVKFDSYPIYAAGQEPFTIDGTVNLKELEQPIADLVLKANNYQIINNSRRTRNTELFGRLAVSLNSTIKGPLDALRMRGNMHILGSTDLTYIMKDSPLTVQDRLNEQVTFVNFADSLQTDSLEGFRAYRPSTMDLLLNLTIDPAVRVRVELSADGTNYVDLEGGGTLVMQGDPQNDISLTGRYTLNSGVIKYAFSMIPLKEFTITNGSYVQWSGNIMNPQLGIKAVETIRSNVSSEGGSSRQVNFNITIALSNTLERLGIAFDISAPEDMEIQNQLIGLSAEERSKRAITALATGMYMDGTGSTKGFSASDALNSLLQSEINSIAGNVLGDTDFSIGVNRYSSGDDQDMSTDYSYKFARRFWNNRIRVVFGGTITQGNDQTNQNSESFIDNVSLEYNFDNAGTKSIRIYYDKDYESILEGEVIETGVGYIYRKKYNRWYEIFPWVKKKPFLPTSPQTESK